LKLVVLLPYTPYAVPVSARSSLNMTPNARNRRRFPDTKAREQMHSDAYYLTREASAYQGVKFEADDPLEMRIVCRSKVSRQRDDDNLIAGLKWARDGIATALGVDDNQFRVQPPEFEKGWLNETEITITRAV
tara:strand:+ start:2710 stop:3108 length:399 start_codon:yes stop_codon:yes gene_type:complete